MFVNISFSKNYSRPVKGHSKHSMLGPDTSTLDAFRFCLKFFLECTKNIHINEKEMK